MQNPLFKGALAISLLFSLSACKTNTEEDTPLPIASVEAPKYLHHIGDAIYSVIKSDPAAAALFAAVGEEKCDVKIFRMSYPTVGGRGESTTSSGVLMLPVGDATPCNGDRPVVLHAHGTTTHKEYDLSAFIADSSNAAAQEAVVLLATFASQGYAVVAPNYAGYADSTLGYHPYLDEAQQSQEMQDSLQHAKTYVRELGVSFSDKLFVTGMSQGGYVAMATHKALQASGETVTASVPISGPYAMLSFMDAVMAGYVNLGSTTFAPLYLTALDEAHDIYSDPAEVYTVQYAEVADGIYPQFGGNAGELPELALFTGLPPADAQTFHYAGFDNFDGLDQGYLLNEDFRNAYLADIANGDNPQSQIRQLAADADLRDWTPQAPILLCGASTDLVVYYTNTTDMLTHWQPLVSAGLVVGVDVAQEVAALGYVGPSVHSGTLPVCAGAALEFFSRF